MATKGKDQAAGTGGVSKMQLAVGAASLFLFIVGLKRTFRVEEESGGRTSEDQQPAERDRPGNASSSR